jgi:hypothetical protein
MPMGTCLTEVDAQLHEFGKFVTSKESDRDDVLQKARLAHVFSVESHGETNIDGSGQ